ncbi:MAG: sigma-54-dependent Fis family transcriptional regulator [Steroidobacteraceae bacterium]|jgi:DNA-binding NtrC family response regulator|nr:sigma-54-dependent Fis family transcriptional regulator [Steroidobacteraceae bacterium]
MTSVISHVEDRLANRTVLVADDSEAVRTAFQVLLSLHGARVLGASSPAEALAAVRSQEVDLVIQDMNFRREATSGEEGIALFRELRALHPDVPVILLTAWTHLETAVDLVKAGAADYIAKPWDDARLLTTVRNLLDLRAAVEENITTRARRAEARAQLAERYDLNGLVYESEALHTVASMAAQVAHADVPVLITGPNGAGKEVLADIVHANSPRKNQPYIKVNAGALPDQLIEAELFGTEAGAFTGAKARAGRFEAADGGTIFLDEIGNLPLAGQAKLLRVLQTGEYERLGSNTTRRANVRVVAATNLPLRDAMREGRFREDLYYRLSVIELQLPPLAERRDDVLPLTRSFLPPGARLTSDAERALLNYCWPGNVRELRNVLQRAALLAGAAPITAATLNLPAVLPARSDEPVLDRGTIERVLAENAQIVAQAARQLGISRQALYRRMEKLGIKESPGRQA